MSDATRQADGDVVRLHRRRAVIASTVGTTIEWYDFFLYGTAAGLIFKDLFFPESSQYAGTLLAFSTQFVGFAARPIGAAIFGHFGDRVGRKATLIATLLIMGIATFLIGCLPTSADIGITAALLLTLLRLLQGIGVGGEWGGSVLMAMEWSPRKRRGLAAAWPQAGVPMGLVLGNGVYLICQSLTGDDFLRWGWRIPFLLSIVLVGIGLYIRLRVLESPAFADVRAKGAVVKMPLADTLRRHWREVLVAMFVRMAEQAPFYLFVTFVLSYGKNELDTNTQPFVLIAAAIGLFSVPFFGYLSDVLGRRQVYAAGIILTGAFAFPYFGLLNSGSTTLMLLAVIGSLIVHDMQYGPQAALIAESFGTTVRYTGAGLGYQLASVIAGGPAPLIAVFLLEEYGSYVPVAWYIVGCAVIALIALAFVRGRPSADDSEYDDAAERGSIPADTQPPAR